MKFRHCIISLMGGLTLLSCSHSNEWSIDGRIEGADGQTMMIEASDNGRWYALDSIKLDASGQFSYSHEAAGYPDIYRLRLGDKTLYFPIDSIEKVTVVTKANAFDTEYTLAGSDAAELLMEVDRRVMAVVNRSGVSAIATDSMLKRDLGGMLLGNPSGIVSYYIINKKIGGINIFSPNNKQDLRIIGAVANAYTQFRPNDPRTTYLKNLYLSNRTISDAAPRDTFVVNELPFVDITLMDDRGASHSLSEITKGGKVVLLNFTVYGADQSPAYNRELNKLWERYHEQGLEIFQVACDEDEFQWRQAARNLPWLTVYNPPSTGGQNLLHYNVTALPTTFVFDRKGDLVERVDDQSRLGDAVARHM